METLTDRWRRLIKEDERFWGICLKVAKSKPYLCAEAVESEATLIFFGLKPEPRKPRPETGETSLSGSLGQS